MTKLTKEKPKRRRVRTSIYGERQNVTIRLPKPLHAELVAYLDSVNESANRFITTLIEEALKRK